MHPQQTQFIEKVRLLYPTKFIGANVLDIGSMDINGRNSQFFYQCNFMGFDIADGPGVDVIIDPDKPLPSPYANFDTVISTECMEHNKQFIHTIQEMIRVLKPGGLMIMTMASHNRPEHGTKDHDPVASPYTNNYYKNIYLKDLTSIPWEETFFPYCFEYSGAYDLYFYGIKNIL